MFEIARTLLSIVGLLMMAFFAYNLFHLVKLLLKHHNSPALFVCFLGALFILGVMFLLVYGLVVR